MSFKPIPLTAGQIKHFDEIEYDKRAAKETLELAMTYHSNRLNELNKAATNLWEELAKANDLDLSKVQYKLSKIDGRVCVVKAEEED